MMSRTKIRNPWWIVNDTMEEDPDFRCWTAGNKECPLGDPCIRNCQRPRDENMKMACITVWHNDAHQQKKIQLQRCFWTQIELPETCRKDCIADTTMIHGNTTSYSCCCDTPLCNKDFQFIPKSTGSPSPERNPKAQLVGESGNEITTSLLYVFLPICFVALLIAFGYWVYRRYRQYRLQLQTVGDGNDNTKSRTLIPPGPLKSIQLIEIVAKGRYGSCWKARWFEQNVAVKIFPNHDVDSWVQEQEIFNTPRLKDHSNILYFIGAEVRGTVPNVEYWLITAYQENGSLHDFLKRHVLTVPEGIRIAVSMLRGLAFLHEEYSGAELTYKPTIVHRDFKSKNVLVKNDLTACIADFGLAVKCVHGRPPPDIHGQVGTRRYMAPEVLEGATEFTAFAFRQIDVYACALVMWELFSRCSFSGEPIDEYKLPFEEEVGLRPSLQELQNLVALHKRRPCLKDAWKQHPHGSVICATIEEMWDVDPDARVTAGCAMERLLPLDSISTGSALLSRASEFNISSDMAPLISEYNSSSTVPIGESLSQRQQNVENA